MKIVCIKDGPYLLSEGKFTIIKDGELIELEKVALCRCGQSANKPFCDGQHKEVRFEAEEMALVQ